MVQVTLLFEQIVVMDLEGIVCEHKDSPYKLTEKPSTPLPKFPDRPGMENSVHFSYASKEPEGHFRRRTNMKLKVMSSVLAGFFLCSHVALADSFSFVPVDLPGSSYTAVYGINDAGQIVGTSNNAQAQIGFLETNGVFTIFDLPGIPGDPVRATIAWDINNAGQILGWSVGAGPFLYANGVFNFISVPSDVDGINDIGQIVGSFNDGAGTHGFLDTNGVLTTIDFPHVGFTNTYARGINNAGQVVGFFDDNRGEHGFLDTNGVFTSIDFPGTFTQTYGINDVGQIVGCFRGVIGSHGLLYSNGVFTTFDLPGATSTCGLAINNAGQIAGVYLDSLGREHGFVATPVPEPGSFSLVVTGLGVIGVLIRAAS